jgi:hypothetical protein
LKPIIFSFFLGILSFFVSTFLQSNQILAADSILTDQYRIYVSDRDPQPKCPSCRVFRLEILSSSKGVLPIQFLTGTIVQKDRLDRILSFVNFNEVEDDGGPIPPRIGELEKLRTFPIALRMPFAFQEDNFELLIRTYGYACEDNQKDECNLLKERGTFVHSVKELFNLEYTKEK